MSQYGEVPGFTEVFPNFTENIPTIAMRSQNIDSMEQSRVGFPVVVKSDSSNGSAVFDAMAEGLEAENLNLSDIQFFCLDDEDHMLDTYAIGLRRRMAQDGLVEREADFGQDGQLKMATENLHTAKTTTDLVKNLATYIESNAELDLGRIYIALDHSLAGDVIDGFQLALVLKTVFTTPGKINIDKFLYKEVLGRVNVLGTLTNNLGAAMLPDLCGALLKLSFEESESGINVRKLYVDRLREVERQLSYMNRFNQTKTKGES